MVNKFNLQERCRIAALMEVYKSTSVVRRHFRGEFMKPPPTHRTVRRIHDKFLSTGSVANKKKVSSRTVTCETNQIRVMAHFDNNARSSIRQASKELQLTRYAIYESLKLIKLKPFRIAPVHGLLTTDYPRRVAACSVFAEMVIMEPDILSRIVFSDEATFHSSALVNTSTCRIWAYENPHASHEFHRDSPKLNVWCGMTAREIFGPFFFSEETVTHTSYLDMLHNYAVPIMHDSGIVESGYFMQDGAPPHWALDVRDYLDENFPSRWIGRDGPLLWPARSPDLTPCDFFLWGFIKNKVYRSPVENLSDLRRRIISACAEITEQTLLAVSNEVIRRWHVAIENGGKQVESVPIEY